MWDRLSLPAGNVSAARLGHNFYVVELKWRRFPPGVHLAHRSICSGAERENRGGVLVGGNAKQDSR